MHAATMSMISSIKWRMLFCSLARSKGPQKIASIRSRLTPRSALPSSSTTGAYRFSDTAVLGNSFRGQNCSWRLRKCGNFCTGSLSRICLRRIAPKCLSARTMPAPRMPPIRSAFRKTLRGCGEMGVDEYDGLSKRSAAKGASELAVIANFSCSLSDTMIASRCSAMVTVFYLFER